MIKDAWNFSVWQQFSEKLYNEAITPENVMDDGAESFYENIFEIRDHMLQEIEIETLEHRYCIKVQKGNKKYLLPRIFQNSMPLKVTKSMKCQLKKSDKTVWEFVQEVSSLNISGESFDTPFKEFITEWNPLTHTNQTTWTFLRLLSFSTRYKGVKCCICSEPESGKNANFTIMGFIRPDVGRLTTPTLAKFETSLFYNRVNIIDELTSIEKSKLRELEPMILAIADNSPEYTKHSMASKKALNKIDLIHSSIIFPYNRREDLKAGGTFFDEIWNNVSAFASRYPQFLIDGQVSEALPKLNKAQSKIVMDQNFDDMRRIAKKFVYWTENLHLHLHNYSRELITLKGRHYANLEGLFDVIDAFCESQEEFNIWCAYIMNSLKRYKGKQFDTTPSPFKVEEVSMG